MFDWLGKDSRVTAGEVMAVDRKSRFHRHIISCPGIPAISTTAIQDEDESDRSSYQPGSNNRLIELAELESTSGVITDCCVRNLISIPTPPHEHALYL